MTSTFSEVIQEQHRRLDILVRECLLQAREMLNGAENAEILRGLLHREERERNMLRTLLEDAQEMAR